MLVSYVSVPEVDPKTRDVLRYVRVPMDEVFDVRSRTGCCTCVLATKGVRFRTEPWLYGPSTTSVASASEQRKIDDRLSKLLIDLRCKHSSHEHEYYCIDKCMQDVQNASAKVAESLATKRTEIMAIMDTLHDIVGSDRSELADIIRAESMEALRRLHAREDQAIAGFKKIYTDALRGTQTL